MTILDLKYYGSSVLTRKAKLIRGVTPEIKKLGHDMVATMKHNSGVGLAGPQVGVSKRIITIDCGKEFQDEPYIMINPKIMKATGTQTGPEGCLSFPELYFPVKRARYVTVVYLDLNGEVQRLETHSLLARAIAHEIDHLDGKLFTTLATDKEMLTEELPILKTRIQTILNI
jgi:peptide deformylase